VVTLASDKTLHFAPIPELKALRYDAYKHPNMNLEPNRELIVGNEFGLHYEALIEVDLDKASQFELRIGRSTDGHQFLPIKYDVKTGRLTFGNKEADFKLNPNEKTLSIHLFVDGCVGEVYINERTCFSNNLSLSPSSTGISVKATGGKVKVKQFSLWKMESIWHGHRVKHKI
jgi:sucrose-6-phosphate hydrolase SacC (GH32 family)